MKFSPRNNLFMPAMYATKETVIVNDCPASIYGTDRVMVAAVWRYGTREGYEVASIASGENFSEAIDSVVGGLVERYGADRWAVDYDEEQEPSYMYSHNGVEYEIDTDHEIAFVIL